MENKIKIKLTNLKCNFQKFLAMESTIYLSIKVAVQLNTLSDGKGITGIQCGFLMRHSKVDKKFKHFFN